MRNLAQERMAEEATRRVFARGVDHLGNDTGASIIGVKPRRRLEIHRANPDGSLELRGILEGESIERAADLPDLEKAIAFGFARRPST